MGDSVLTSYQQQEPADPRTEQEKREDRDLEQDVTQQLHLGWEGQCHPDHLPCWNAIDEGCRFALVSLAGPGLPQKSDRPLFKYRGAANTRKAIEELSVRVHAFDPTTDTMYIPFGVPIVFPHSIDELRPDVQATLLRETLSGFIDEFIHNRDDLAQRMVRLSAPPPINPDDFFEQGEKKEDAPAVESPQVQALPDPPHGGMRPFLVWSVIRWKDRIVLKLRASMETGGEEGFHSKIARLSPLWDTYLTTTGGWLDIPEHPTAVGEDKVHFIHRGLGAFMTAQREQRREQHDEISRMENALKPEMLKEHEMQKHAEREEGTKKEEVPIDQTKRRRTFRDLLHGKKV